MVGRHRLQWGPMMGHLVTGRIRPGRGRAKSHPLLGLVHPGQSVVQTTGQERRKRQGDGFIYWNIQGEVLCPQRRGAPGDRRRWTGSCKADMTA